MAPKSRSIGGGLMMLVIIPVVAALLACMPVPIGNPERSRIDPEMSGLWTMRDSDGDMIVIVLLEPYDKRTWLGIMVEPYLDKSLAQQDAEIDTYEGLVAATKDRSSGFSAVRADQIGLYKIWLTKLGGEKFMVWQPKGVSKEGDFGADWGYNWHLTKYSASSFDLNMIDLNHPAFEGVDEKDRKALEKVIRKHASEPELYDGEPFTFSRVNPEHANLLGRLIYSLMADE